MTLSVPLVVTKTQSILYDRGSTLQVFQKGFIS